MYSINELIFFLQEVTGVGQISPDADLTDDIGITGGDFHELMNKYADRFHVDMKEYKWYFHTVDEASLFNIGGLFFDPPYKKVERIPVTAIMLLDFANKGKWGVSYPNHHVPKIRYDMLINQILFIALVIWLLIKFTKNY